ncbi:unnamed protein product [Ophioblennius macclurei]
MSSVEALREFINQRLTAAAGEIFTVFQQTIVRYEEEIDRQHRLLEIRWKPQRESHGSEDLEEEQLDNEETNSVLDQDEILTVEIKEDLIEVGTGLEEEEELLLKQETETFTGPEPDPVRLRAHDSPASPYEGPQHRATSASERNCEPNPDQRRSADSKDECPVSGNFSEEEPDKKCSKCGICGKTLKCVSQMLLHRRTHTGEKPYSCGMCGRTFSQKHHLKNHMIIHSDNKPHYCEICKKGFKHKSSYLSHLKIHKGEKPHACDVCGKRFCERGNLLVHMRSHTDERPFFCETCGKSYKYRNYLLVHMRTHTGEKPFLCNACGKTFRTSSALHKHAATHTGEKHDTLLRHMTTHMKPRRFQTRKSNTNASHR